MQMLRYSLIQQRELPPKSGVPINVMEMSVNVAFFIGKGFESAPASCRNMSSGLFSQFLFSMNEETFQGRCSLPPTWDQDLSRSVVPTALLSSDVRINFVPKGQDLECNSTRLTMEDVVDESMLKGTMCF